MGHSRYHANTHDQTVACIVGENVTSRHILIIDPGLVPGRGVRFYIDGLGISCHYPSGMRRTCIPGHRIALNGDGVTSAETDAVHGIPGHRITLNGDSATSIEVDAIHGISSNHVVNNMADGHMNIGNPGPTAPGDQVVLDIDGITNHITAYLDARAALIAYHIVDCVIVNDDVG